MTSQGLDAAIDTWLGAYAKFFQGAAPAPKQHCGKHQHEGNHEGCEGDHENCEHHHQAEEE